MKSKKINSNSQRRKSVKNKGNPLETKIRNILRNRILKDINVWKKPNKKEMREAMEKYYLENKDTQAIMKLKIRKNRVIKPKTEYLYKIYKLRGIILYKMFNQFMSKINYNKKKYANFDLYICLRDIVVNEDLPFFYFAKCLNQNGILIPDWTFHTPYKSKIKTNWHNQIIQISKVCDRITEKKDLVFFQGADTSGTSKPVKTSKKTLIRRNLKNVGLDKNNNFPMEILIDDEPKTSVTDWCSYKYLLDLPGAHPWSVRFKELLLTGSLVIKVDVKDRWINFYSDIFKPSEDYIQVIFDNKEYLEEKYESAEKTYSDIKKVVKEVSDEDIQRITESANKKIKMVNNKMLTFYFETLINQYLERFC